MIVLQDGLRTHTGFVAQAPKPCLIYCRVPDDWVDGDIPDSTELWIKGPELRADKMENLFESLYGKTWRSGNSDGSQYVVMGFSMRLLNPTESQPEDDPNNTDVQFFYFVAAEDGQFKSVSRSEF